MAKLAVVLIAVGAVVVTYRWVSPKAFLIAKKSRQAKRFCSGLRNKNAG